MARGNNKNNPFIPPRYGKPPILRLSPEIRRRIFKLMFAHSSLPIIVAPFESHSDAETGTLCAEESARSAQVLAVCKLFAAEGTPVLYGCNAMVLRGARRVAQLMREDWWKVNGRYMLREVVVSDCANYFAVARQVVGLHTAQLGRVVVEPPLVVLTGLALLRMSERQLREAALREACYVYSQTGQSRDLADEVVRLVDLFPWVEIVLRVAAKLEYCGGNIAPPCIFEYGLLDIVGQDDF